MGKRETPYYPLGGGLDFVTPPIAMREGMLIAGRNVEPWINGGYRRVKGYERYDGRPRPSDATWQMLNFLEALSNVPTVGDPDYLSVATLLSMDGVDTATTFVDQASVPLIWTAIGNAQLRDTHSAFGNTSLYLDGTTDYIVTTGNDTFDFLHEGTGGTFETQYYSDGAIEPGLLFATDRDGGTTKVGIYFLLSANGSMRIIVARGVASQATIDLTTAAGVVSPSTEHAIAFTTNSAGLSLYVDGVVVGTQAINYPWPSGNHTDEPLVGYGVGSGDLKAWMSDIRITAVDRYADAAYTPATDHFPANTQSPPTEVGDTLSGQTSGATGEVTYIELDRLTCYVTRATGTFAPDEVIDNDTSPTPAIGTLDGYPIPEGARTVQDWGERRYEAQEVYRADIQQVPGSGPVRCVWQFEDSVYAVRDNPGGTAGIMYKATPAGWDSAPITMALYLEFDAGSVEPAVGDVITGGSSGATGTATRVIITNSAFSSTLGAGYIVFDSITGTFTDDEDIEVSASKVAEANGTQKNYVLPPGGRYMCINNNFYANTAQNAAYMTNGVGAAISLINDEVVPILIDMTVDDAPSDNRPYGVAAFDARLWLMFPAGSIQHSLVGAPLDFNGFLGAAEYGLGDNGTTLDSLAGDVLIARTRKHTYGFYKDGAGGYILKKVSDEAGAIQYTAETLSTSYCLDEAGISNFERTDKFGDFANATVSDAVQPWLEQRLEHVAGTMIIRKSNQYRLLMANGDGLIMRVKQDGLTEFGILSMPTSVFCSYSSENAVGTPSNWFGGDEGYAFQAEIGQNWDGAEIEATARLPYTHQDRPSWKKRYFLAEIEMSGKRNVELLGSMDMNYSGPDVGSLLAQDEVVGGGGFFDVSNWDKIFWDARTFTTARLPLSGSGHNMSLMLYNRSKVTDEFILQGLQLHFMYRRVRR